MVTPPTSPPLIDVAALLDGDDEPDTAAVVDQIHRACVETGFFAVTGHGLDDELGGVLAAARSFFDQPQADKEQVPRIQRYGFVPHSGSAIDLERASDRTEYLDLGLLGPAPGTSGAGPQLPLPDLPGFETTVRAYQIGALALGRALLRAMARALGIDPDFFARRMTDPQCRLRLLHYPSVEAGPDGSVPVTTDPHTDYGLITLLATEGVAGLEVRPIAHPGGAAPAWTPVAARPGDVVVNLGDMMARWTNDRYRSTPHRVVGPAEGDRISIPFFVNPDPAVVVETIPACVTADRPLRYRPVTAGRFLARRIDGDDEPATDRNGVPA